jgi:hypothetical protein
MQLDHRYRLLLWELVYHDCVVAQWYWGNHDNKLLALWNNPRGPGTDSRRVTGPGWDPWTGCSRVAHNRWGPKGP